MASSFDGDLGISTAWGVERFPDMAAFAKAAQEMGFAALEVNYEVSSEDIDVIRSLRALPVHSVHAPTPKTALPDGRSSHHLSLTAIDPEERETILAYTRASIDLAAEFGARAVVLHLGHVGEYTRDHREDIVGEERGLRRLWESGPSDPAAYRAHWEHLVGQRAALAPQYLELGWRSLRNLAPYAAEHGIRLGLETRAYFHEIPNLEEMAQLLDDFDRDVVGYWHDTGHAEILARLGFTPHKSWFDRFAGRLIGAHLHDLRGVSDHRAPGTGDLDWQGVASRLPTDSLRILELDNWNEDADVQAAIGFLRNGILVP